MLHVPPPVGTLSADLSSILRKRTEHTLVTIIKRNKDTRYFSESPVFSDFHRALETIGLKEDRDREVRDDILLENYSNIPLTTYDTCEPFVNKFFEDRCRDNDVRDIFSPGLPYHVSVSSATSHGKPKFIPKYRQPDSPPIRWPSGAGKMCFVFSLHPHKVIGVQNEDGDTIENISVGLNSSGMMREALGLDIDKDHLNIKLAGFTTSPVAVSFITDYRSFMLMHALFALAENELESIATLFTTYFVDMIGYMEEEWNNLVTSIKTGEIPDWDGTDHVREYLQPHFPARPERAAELHVIGSAKEESGWLLKVWPKLKNIMAVSSGIFATLVPKIRRYVGPGVTLWSSGFVASEAFVGMAYDPSDANLFKVTGDEVVEYLAVAEEEQSASKLIAPWQVELGKRYEVVVTTRNGLWRYRLGDVIEIAGFHPADGTPIVRYVERCNVMLQMAGRAVTESQVIDAILAVQDTFGLLIEFTAVIDDRNGHPSVGYLVEVHGELYSTADEAPAQLRTALAGIIEWPEEPQATIRVLRSNTFREYRRWKTGTAKTGAGQVKVPVLMLDETARQWMCDRIERELGVLMT